MHRLEARLAWFLPPLLLATSCLGLAQKGPSLTQEPSNAEPAHNYVPAPRNLIRDLNAHGISLQAMLVFDWSKSLAGNDATLGFGASQLFEHIPVRVLCERRGARAELPAELGQHLAEPGKKSSKARELSGLLKL